MLAHRAQALTRHPPPTCLLRRNHPGRWLQPSRRWFRSGSGSLLCSGQRKSRQVGAGLLIQGTFQPAIPSCTTGEPLQVELGRRARRRVVDVRSPPPRCRRHHRFQYRAPPPVSVTCRGNHAFPMYSNAGSPSRTSRTRSRCTSRSASLEPSRTQRIAYAAPGRAASYSSPFSAPHGGESPPRGPGISSFPPAARIPLVRFMTVRSYSAKRSCSERESDGPALGSSATDYPPRELRTDQHPGDGQRRRPAGERTLLNRARGTPAELEWNVRGHAPSDLRQIPCAARAWPGVRQPHGGRSSG